METRRLRRTIGPIPAVFRAGESWCQGEILAVSKKGLFMGSTQIPPVGTEVQVVFHYGLLDKIVVTGRLSWTTDQLPPDQDHASGFGMVFNEQSENYLEFFEQILLPSLPRFA